MVILKPVYYPLFEDNEKFIILITGGRGCESPEQEIIMSDMSIKKLKDVQIGDYVMGDDFTTRRVLDKLSGRSEMYRVHQSSAEDYIVNDAHILTVRNGNDIRDINVLEYNSNDGYKGYKVFRDGRYECSDLSIEPVGIGDWCGICLDGNQRYLHSDGTVTHNSGKSFGASTFLERLTFEYNKEMGISHNILLCRYTMTSASISVIPEFTEKIDLDGTAEYFRTTKQDVVNKMTGARVMFRGIHTSSGNQTAKLKSIQGITTFVCDEAEEWTNYDDFEKIMLSIRQKGLQNRIIIIMNPADTNHFVYEKYIKDTHKLVEFDGVPVQISTHPDVLHIHTSYLDNIEHLSENFLNAAREMKENDPERYAHIFMGRWDDVAEGAVFKKFGIVDEFPEDCQHVGLGMDFGYFPDPSAVVRCGIIGNKLYIDEVGYAQGWHAPQMAECLNQYPDLFTYGESADERLTNDIAHLGPIIYRVEKGPGSIMAGINKMLEYEIFITKRSVHLEHELRNYVWAKDVFGKYVGMPEDHDNHCFIAGTKVRMEDGEKNIEDIKVGDYVLTSGGAREVLTTFDNGVKKVISVKIHTTGGIVEFTATPDHKIKTTQGWKQLKDLTQGDIVYLYKPSMGKNTFFTPAKNISEKATQHSIGLFGSITMDQSAKDTTSTTRTRTRGIMTFLISKCLRGISTLVTIFRSALKTKNSLMKAKKGLTMQGSLRTSGTGQKKGGSGTENMENRFLPISKKKNIHASGAATSIGESHLECTTIAQINVKPQQGITLGLTTKQEYASNVEENLLQTDTQKLNFAQEVAQRNTTTCTEQIVLGIETVKEDSLPVFNIMVDDLHEFFASDLLVSNCIDSARYYIRGRIQGKILKPRATTKEELGIF